jgi:GNAT superfamily N-acetyltransferase
MSADARAFSTRPLTPETWADLEDLFGLPGGSIVAGCWCMFYRRTGKPPGYGGPPGSVKAANKRAMCDLVNSGVVPGLIGFSDGHPVVCSYVARPYRGRGVQHLLLDAAVDYARRGGARVLEAYPVDKPERSHDDFMFFGARSLYERAGFREVVRRSPTRVVMRLQL